MASIEDSGLPLVFPVANPPEELPGGDAPPAAGTSLRTVVRALTGMQKEAVVGLRPDGTVWRLVSDEGPYLNGTDLAPFPLAFFAAGMQFCLLAEVLRAARDEEVTLDSVALELDNRYAMEGSFLRGDAHAGAFPPELSLDIEAAASADRIAQVVSRAVDRCPAQSLVRNVITNTFAFSVNGAPVELDDLPRLAAPAAYRGARFDSLRPSVEPARPIIEKLEAAEVLEGVEGGAGSSLRAEQKRTLHVHSRGRWVGDTRMECDVHLLKPIGSTFRFRSDETPGGEAPPPLVYLTAGIGFCFMTQIGRYAHIIKHPLTDYAIVQDNTFEFTAGATRPGPTETHLLVETDDPDSASDFVTVGERTCFLHAAMRTAVPGVVDTRLNGEPLRHP